MLKNLKALREEAGISQKQLAELIGTSQQSINKYENHKIEPDVDTMIRIADYFETSVDYLIGHSPIRRKLEQIYPYDLNADEGRLIEQYRRLTEKQRDSVQTVMDSYCI